MLRYCGEKRLLPLVRYYSSAPAKSLPKPTAEVPDVQTFLKKIGRNMEQHAEHFESWESLMDAKSNKLKEKGIDTRDRRYLLSWLERYQRNVPLQEYKRGQKQWGGERNRRANRAAFYGRKRAEERNSSA